MPRPETPLSRNIPAPWPAKARQLLSCDARYITWNPVAAGLRYFREGEIESLSTRLRVRKSWNNGDTCGMGRADKRFKLKKSFLDTEFRVQVLADGSGAMFVPSDANGNRRNGLVIRLRGDENQNDIKVVLSWRPDDRILLQRDDTKEPFENSFFNERTTEKTRL